VREMQVFLVLSASVLVLLSTLTFSVPAIGYEKVEWGPVEMRSDA
jgi:hypothetical protein